MSDSICPICKSNDCTDKIGILYEFNVDSTALISDEIIEVFKWKRVNNAL